VIEEKAMHVAVTGASSGIGEAIAREFAGAGAKLTLVARRRELLEKLAAELGASTHIAVKDLSLPESADDWVAAAETANGPIDVLVNNAGIENSGPFEGSDAANALKLLRTNLETPLVLARRLVPGMIQRGQGAIVNVASVSALSPMALQACYAGSKAGLAAFSEALRAELRATGVVVVTVYPGPVKTSMADAAYEVFGGRKGIVGLLPEGTTEVLARRIRRAVSRRKARVIYPRFYALSRWFPWVGSRLAWFAGPRLRARALEAKPKV
jgi:short-subunit dehydrogenase